MANVHRSGTAQEQVNHERRISKHLRGDKFFDTIGINLSGDKK
jgi:hypothetical protein